MIEFRVSNQFQIERLRLFGRLGAKENKAFVEKKLFKELLMGRRET